MRKALLTALLILFCLFFIVAMKADFIGLAVLKTKVACIDNDIGERSIYIKSNVDSSSSFLINTKNYVFEDVCVDNYLKEYYCNGNNPEFVIYNCEGGCSGGICLE